jgi:hypothetical protein
MKSVIVILVTWIYCSYLCFTSLAFTEQTLRITLSQFSVCVIVAVQNRRVLRVVLSVVCVNSGCDHSRVLCNNLCVFGKVKRKLEAAKTCKGEASLKLAFLEIFIEYYWQLGEFN